MSNTIKVEIVLSMEGGRWFADFYIKYGERLGVKHRYRGSSGRTAEEALRELCIRRDEMEATTIEELDKVQR